MEVSQPRQNGAGCLPPAGLGTAVLELARTLDKLQHPAAGTLHRLHASILFLQDKVDRAIEEVAHSHREPLLQLREILK